MFTNDQMDRVPDEIAKLFREMENDITFDIVNRLGELNKITRTIDYQLYVATQMRTYDHDLRQVIQQYTNKSQKQMEDMFNEVLSEGYAQDADLYKAQGIPFVPFEENDSMQQMVRALVTQADDDLSNITRTLGIAFRDGTKENLTQYFRDTLNRATVEMMAGAFSYDSTMKRVITDLSNSGIRTISYESGHVDRVDVAASRAVRTGFNQAVSKISDANAGKLQTEYFEVSAHLTARPSHALWQGKVYSRKQLVEICGLGTGPGLLGWNCRHSYYPFIPGVSKRTYTDEQLADIYQKSLETKEWRGQKYTGYEATQYQRMLERRMRVQDEKIRLMKQAGVDNNEIADLKTKHEATYQEYKQFSEKMGLPEQMNRVFNSEVKVAAAVKKERSNDADLVMHSSSNRTVSKETVIELGKKEDLSEFDLAKISPAQNKHIRGTKEYDYLSKTREYPPSYITISEKEEIDLIKEFAGKGYNFYNNHGEWVNTEIILTNDKPIGYVVNNLNGVTQETSVFKIHYSKKGIHIVPDYMSKKNRR